MVDSTDSVSVSVDMETIYLGGKVCFLIRVFECYELKWIYDWFVQYPFVEMRRFVYCIQGVRWNAWMDEFFFLLIFEFVYMCIFCDVMGFLIYFCGMSSYLFPIWKFLSFFLIDFEVFCCQYNLLAFQLVDLLWLLFSPSKCWNIKGGLFLFQAKMLLNYVYCQHLLPVNINYFFHCFCVCFIYWLWSLFIYVRVIVRITKTCKSWIF